jgi:xanthine dehydrogenase YagR molybdenum-binding subunit
VKAIGQGIDRVDGRLKVTGAARYSAEIPVAGVAYAVIVSSGVTRGKIVHLDTAAAEHEPGVLAVLTRANAPHLDPLPPPPKALGDRVLQVLQDDLVRYQRQPIALVVADTLERATHAAALVKATYAAEAPAVEVEPNRGDATKPKNATPEQPVEYSRGHVAPALAAAPARVDAVYTTPFETHNPMEPHATIAAWQGDKLTLYDATQGIFEVRRKASATFRLPKENVRVISHFLGGGFGCKGSTWSHVILAAMAARELRRPVKLVLERRQMFGPVGGRPRTVQSIALGAQKTGELTALKHESLSANCRFDEFVEHTTAPTRALYACPNMETSERLVALDVGTPTFQRAPGEASGNFAVESAMDELAVALAIDPIALRLKNHADKDPATGKPWSSKSLKACYREGAAKFGWAKRTPRPRSMRDGDLLVGWGMATATYPAHLRPASALARLLDDGTAVVLAGSQDIGTGTYTIMTQIAADALGVPIERIHFDLGDSEMPETPGSGGSQTAASVGSAVHKASLAVRQQVVDLARSDPRSPVSGAPDADVTLENGRVSKKGDPTRGEPFQDVLKRAGKRALEARVENKPSGEREKYQTRAFGAQFIEVKVDPDLGQARVTRAVGAFACGKILNAKTARSQFIGGIVWGIGMALTEETRFDPRLGRIMNADLGEYQVPVNLDVPDIEVILVDEQDAIVNELGIKGIGEIGITGVAAAIANAIYHATGKRLRDLPIRVEHLL